MSVLRVFRCEDGVFRIAIADEGDSPEVQQEQAVDALIMQYESIWRRTIANDPFDMAAASAVASRLSSDVQNAATPDTYRLSPVLARRLSYVEPEFASANELSLPISGICMAILTAAKDPIVSLSCLQNSREIMCFNPEDLLEPSSLSATDDQWLVHLCARLVAQIYQLHPTLRRFSWIEADTELSAAIEGTASYRNVNMQPRIVGLQTPPATQQPGDIDTSAVTEALAPDRIKPATPTLYPATPPPTQTSIARQDQAPGQPRRFGLRRQNAMVPHHEESTFELRGVVAAEGGQPITPPHTQDTMDVSDRSTAAHGAGASRRPRSRETTAAGPSKKPKLGEDAD